MYAFRWQRDQRCTKLNNSSGATYSVCPEGNMMIGRNSRTYMDTHAIKCLAYRPRRKTSQSNIHVGVDQSIAHSTAGFAHKSKVLLYIQTTDRAHQRFSGESQPPHPKTHTLHTPGNLKHTTIIKRVGSEHRHQGIANQSLHAYSFFFSPI